MRQPFDPLEHLCLATELATNKDETSRRAAVNRAYYAMFLIARDKVNITGTENVHSRTLQRVKSRPGFLVTGTELDDLRKLRVEADYLLMPSHPDYDDWEESWKDAELKASRILKKLQDW